MTRKDKVTPLQAARQYAAEHPEFEGAIDVTVLRPKGRDGWGVARNTVRAWARDGRAALRTSARKVYEWNGYCRTCGRVYLEPVIGTAYRDDERAGQPLGPEDDDERERFAHAWLRYESTFGKSWGEPVYAQRCEVLDICADCMTSLGMTREDPHYRPLARNEIVCKPAGFVARPEPPVVVIDLTR